MTYIWFSKVLIVNLFSYQKNSFESKTSMYCVEWLGPSTAVKINKQIFKNLWLPIRLLINQIILIARVAWREETCLQTIAITLRFLTFVLKTATNCEWSYTWSPSPATVFPRVTPTGEVSTKIKLRLDCTFMQYHFIQQYVTLFNHISP